MAPNLLLLIGGIFGVLVGLVIGQMANRRNLRVAWSNGHVEGQIAMKERVRSEINEGVDTKGFAIHFRDGREITAEQLLEFICYGVEPDAKDETRGKAGYRPR